MTPAFRTLPRPGQVGLQADGARQGNPPGPGRPVLAGRPAGGEVRGVGGGDVAVLRGPTAPGARQDPRKWRGSAEASKLWVQTPEPPVIDGRPTGFETAEAATARAAFHGQGFTGRGRRSAPSRFAAPGNRKPPKLRRRLHSSCTCRQSRLGASVSPAALAAKSGRRSPPLGVKLEATAALLARAEVVQFLPEVFTTGEVLSCEALGRPDFEGGGSGAGVFDVRFEISSPHVRLSVVSAEAATCRGGRASAPAEEEPSVSEEARQRSSSSSGARRPAEGCEQFLNLLLVFEAGDGQFHPPDYSDAHRLRRDSTPSSGRRPRLRAVGVADNVAAVGIREADEDLRRGLRAFPGRRLETLCVQRWRAREPAAPGPVVSSVGRGSPSRPSRGGSSAITAEAVSEFAGLGAKVPALRPRSASVRRLDLGPCDPWRRRPLSSSRTAARRATNWTGEAPDNPDQEVPGGRVRSSARTLAGRRLAAVS